MGIRAWLTGGETASTTTGRTPAERRRREREIRAIDNRTSRWLNSGGMDPKKRGR